MKHKLLTVGILLIFVLSGCSRKKAVDPILPLTKITMDPEREVVYEATRQAWLAVNPVPVLTGQPDQIQPVQPVNPDGQTGSLEAEGTVTPKGFYQLQPGETPKCIARRADVDWLKLYSMNNISFENEKDIQPGTILIIPQNSVWSDKHGPRASADHPTDYTVQAGDTLNSIACIYGDISPEDIALANGLTDPSQVFAGQVLKIP